MNRERNGDDSGIERAQAARQFGAPPVSGDRRPQVPGPRS